MKGAMIFAGTFVGAFALGLALHSAIPFAAVVLYTLYVAF